MDKSLPKLTWVEVVGEVKSRAFGITFGTVKTKTVVPLTDRPSVLFDKNGVKVSVRVLPDDDNAIPVGMDTD